MGGVGGGIPNTPGTTYGGATDPSAIQIMEGFRLIPSIQVAERYDSNVYYAPKSQTQGLTRQDYVTTTAPQLRGLYAGSLVSVNATAAAVAEYYAMNTGLSYVGLNAGIALDMSKLLGQWREGSTLTVSDGYTYTPQPPAFLSGDQSGDSANPLVRGFQTNRNNTTANVFTANLAVPISQVVKLIGGYSNGFRHFGSSQVPQAGGLINQNFQTYSAGLSMQVSNQDTISTSFIDSEFDSGSAGTFTTRGGTIGWRHGFTPTISMNSYAGAAVLSGDSNGVPLSSTIAPTAGLSILWKDSTTSATFGYTGGITPSYQFQSAALLTHTVSFNVVQQTPIRELLGVFNLNYGVANQYGSSSGPSVSYTTVGGGGGLLYKFTAQTYLALNYNYLNFENKFGGTVLAFDKHVVQMSLAHAF